MSAKAPTQATGVKKPQWWTHLRDWKKVFWGRARARSKQEIERETR